MTDNIYTPVIAGLATGAFFIVLLSFSSSLTSINSNATVMSDRISIVTISNTPDASFEPDVIKVIIESNNTVWWINKYTVPISVVANKDDLAFFRATNDERSEPNFLIPDKSFEFTFAKAGVFSYHSVPHLQCTEQS